MTYAKGTKVTVASSQVEVARILARYGITTYQFGQDASWAEVAFIYKRDLPLPVRIRVEMPAPKEEQLIRERWRALVLFIKASLESCELGIVKPQDVFMSFLVASEGRTLGELVLPDYQSRLAIEAG